MTDIATIGTTTITTESVRDSTDGKAFEFIKNETIDRITKSVIAYIKHKTDVEAFPEDLVLGAIYQFASWQLYLVYVESISEYIEGQNPRIIDDRIDKFKELAKIYLSAIGISLDIDRSLTMSPTGIALTGGAKDC